MLRDHLQRYDPVFQHAAIGMALISLQGSFIQVNPVLCELLGYSQQQPHYISQLDHAYQDVLSAVIEFGGSLQSQQLPQGTFDMQILQVAGRQLTVTIHLTLIYDEQVPLYYWAQFENRSLLTETKTQLLSTETMLRDIQDSYQQLLEKMPLAVLITKNGVIQYVNPAALRLVHARDQSEAIGISTDEIVDSSYHNSLSERRKTYYEHQTPLQSITYLINCMDGQQKLVEGFTLLINYDGGPAAVGVFKDITEQREKEEFMMQSEKLTMAGQLAAGIAHEIRNPLTSINGFMKLLRSSDRSSEAYFDIMESELKRIELIVNELLVLSKPQSKHKSQAVDILLVIDQVVTLMDVQATLKNIEILFDKPDSPVQIVGEVNQLKQVFINLLKNGMDAMASSGSIHVMITTNEHEVLISVKDEGSGMTAEQIQQLGQPFYTTKDTGTGLGYMITQNIIHNHGGSIQIDSVPDRGTTFTVKLPKLVSVEASSN
ncbi:ATP-binding protein [Paenibacillus chibensis]|uniref:ATP-binding protein n=1 Tax=Paenibacillus chibensis TaxID=59846 RepID=UPI000FD82838|nr:ATP-binding protein [Paenibacillus chibensis]MEC0370582.1 ATP-binding protein [Paenibacillus chibensis]